MKIWKISFVLIASASISTLAWPGGAHATPLPQTKAPSADPAMALVQRLDTAHNLERLANRVAGSTVTFAGLARSHGTDNARQIVAEEITKARPGYQAQWDHNLAEIYARYFSTEELRSLLAQGPRSPYTSKLVSTHEAIALDMRKASSGILQQLVTESLTNAARR